MQKFARERRRVIFHYETSACKIKIGRSRSVETRGLIPGAFYSQSRQLIDCTQCNKRLQVHNVT